jgi:hypothetical protein
VPAAAKLDVDPARTDRRVFDEPDPRMLVKYGEGGHDRPGKPG